MRREDHEKKMKKTYLFEDHDQSLPLWRNNRIRGLDLVHIDAHIDCNFHEAEPIDVILRQARSVAELKRKLEYSQAYRRFEKDFSKQVDIGNYIYPAMRDGIVRDFYWVIPGYHKEFCESRKVLVATLKQLIKIEGSKAEIKSPTQDVLTARIFDRNFSVCTLESLPHQKNPVILDIDIDFLVTKSARAADNTTDIGKRKPWITPEELHERLQKKVSHPRIATIAYSCNGGYTPMKYRVLGDELAFLFDAAGYRDQYARNLKAAQWFARFCADVRNEHYARAVRLNPVYRAPDNNYGPLYLAVKKNALARKEFMKVKKADSDNCGSLAGLGLLALNKKDLMEAKKYFSRVLHSPASSMFRAEKVNSLIGLAQAEYKLGHLAQARHLLFRFRKQRPLEPFCRYLLGLIAQKQKDLTLACRYYTQAIRLGFGGLRVLVRLAKISFSCKEKESIIRLIRRRLAQIKKERQKRFRKKEKKRIVLLERFLGLKARS